ncbi:hypothetical protein SD457_06930 [Coprobacillaceae bacterium CR2/5/TPMF4]|nr:hypothetical protein SD457_06930 [Coprobacillaceae bacterium CR2/5/TPMF4]
MGEIKVGEQVFGDDGELHNVTGVYPQGVKDVYKVTFLDGTSTRCGKEHLWKVYTTKQRANMRKHGDERFKVLTLEEIMKDYKKNKAINILYQLINLSNTMVMKNYLLILIVWDCY